MLKKINEYCFKYQQASADKSATDPAVSKDASSGDKARTTVHHAAGPSTACTSADEGTGQASKGTKSSIVSKVNVFPNIIYTFFEFPAVPFYKHSNSFSFIRVCFMPVYSHVHPIRNINVNS
jgi:hypothetical protein